MSRLGIICIFLIAFLLALTSWPGCCFRITADLRPTHLRCEDLANPLGVEAAVPRLAWILESSERNQKQKAYQVLVAGDPVSLRQNRGDLWDTGLVPSDRSVDIAYGGMTLVSRQKCFWKVRVWDSAGVPSEWSAPAFWEMGMMQSSDWQAQWIGSAAKEEPMPLSGFFSSPKEQAAFDDTVRMDGRSTLLRKSFTLGKRVKDARVFVSGLGYYELYCNGRRVGDHVLAPAKSNYRKWVLYDIYDLASFLDSGENVLGLQLGNGWFNPYKRWWQPYRMQWFGAKRAKLQLFLEFEDGSSQVILTDASWKTAPGPVLFSCIYDGEIYDGREEQPGWANIHFDDTAWQTAGELSAPGGEMRSQLMPAIKVHCYLRPVAVSNPQPGIFVFDMGQNFAGWARLTVAGSSGTRISMRYAEDVYPDGTIDVRSNEKARATDVYILKGQGLEVYEPRFTFHGFRYVEVTGFPGTPSVDNLQGCLVHTACDSSGAFSCSNELINRIHKATLWSQCSNLMGYPMDCPQRDERLGWFGDALVTAEEAMLNFDMPAFYRQWFEGIRYNQNEKDGDISIISPRPYMSLEPDPTWSCAYPVMVWQYYLHYGDIGILEQHFASMRGYVDYLGTQADEHILPKYWIGDWGTIAAGWQEGDPPFIGTAFYYYDASIIAKAARALGRSAEEARYRQLAQEIRQSFNRRFFALEKRQYDQGSQFANALPMFLGLAEDKDRPALLQNILADIQRQEGHFTVGVLGTKYLMDALSQAGRSDVAYQLVNQRGYPGWAHMLRGRTTLCEFWDLRGSHNHVMLGSVDAWFYRVLAGIQPDEAQPGFKHILIKPFIPDSLLQVRASVRTVRGTVAVEWSRNQSDLELKVVIPANATATVSVPVGPAARVTSRQKLEPSRIDAGYAQFELGSGVFVFQSTL